VTGARKFIIFVLGLCCIVALAAMVWAGAPTDAMVNFAWTIVVLVSGSSTTLVGERAVEAWKARGAFPFAVDQDSPTSPGGKKS